MHYLEYYNLLALIQQVYILQRILTYIFSKYRNVLKKIIVKARNMEKKNTDGLQQELMDSPDLEQFLSQNQEQFVNKSVSELLNHLFEKKVYFQSRSRQTVRYE